MNRRMFMGLMGGAVAGLALDQAIPFNRVWSFPKKIVVPNLGLEPGDIFTMDSVNRRNFVIGDVVTATDWPGLFIVSRVHPTTGVELLRRPLLLAKVFGEHPAGLSRRPTSF